MISYVAEVEPNFMPAKLIPQSLLDQVFHAIFILFGDFLSNSFRKNLRLNKKNFPLCAVLVSEKSFILWHLNLAVFGTIALSRPVCLLKKFSFYRKEDNSEGNKFFMTNRTNDLLIRTSSPSLENSIRHDTSYGSLFKLSLKNTFLMNSKMAARKCII